MSEYDHPYAQDMCDDLRQQLAEVTRQRDALRYEIERHDPPGRNRTNGEVFNELMYYAQNPDKLAEWLQFVTDGKQVGVPNAAPEQERQER